MSTPGKNRAHRRKAAPGEMPAGPVLPSGVVDRALERLFPAPSEYLWDPVTWGRHKMNHYYWSKQIEIMESVANNRFTAVKSCHGPGKTHTASDIVSWWLDPDTHALGSAFAITTAPSWSQVEAILWRYIRRNHHKAKLPGRITRECQWLLGEAGTKRLDESEEIIGMGRKPQDYDEDTFQGIHAAYLLAVLDEANGIPELLWDSVLALATNKNARVLAIGNPDDPNSRFAKVCKPGSGWNVIKISAWDVLRAIEEEGIPEEVAEQLTSWEYIETARKEWGEGSPRWQSKVEGEFPDVSDEYLISPALIEKCQQLDLPGLVHGRYGADIARYGQDKSVLYHNRGGVIRLVAEWAKEDTMSSSGRIARTLRSHGNHRPPANIDVIGLGAGVYDRLREQRLNVAPYQGSSRALNPAKFKNRRAETWWTFREMMEEGLIDLDPADDTLAAQLGSVKWGTDSAGRIYIETKEDMMDRGLPSPNHADAAIMSTVSAGVIAEHHRDGGQQDKSVTADLLTKVM
jgi:hypothetical protein